LSAIMRKNASGDGACHRPDCTVAPRRPPNANLRTREHLTPDEVEQLIEAAKANRHGHRDALMVLLAYRHGLRAAVVDLRWEHVDFKSATLSVRRVKNGNAGAGRALIDSQTYSKILR
jgi:integrase